MIDDDSMVDSIVVVDDSDIPISPISCSSSDDDNEQLPSPDSHVHVDHSYHSGNEMVSSSLPEENIASHVPNTLMVSSTDSSNIAESKPLFSINEWNGFKIVGDSIDWFKCIHYMCMLMTLVVCYYE